MTIKHRIRCFDSEVLVCAADRAYNVNIQTTSNPLGFGRTLAAFETLESAVEAAEHFCLAYRIAKEHGYYLKDNELVRHEREPIAVRWVMERRWSGEEWIEVLTRGAGVR
ncbi:hypothetical protein [Paenibacillus flagellatus]|uniref:Uncharacterized protein n=1 Tax=Paenibacillus flagellatus TaxID=2211139 RepID=A0A2V5JZN2_9BACL|nr:hypothetical protein [Paenibacillus flagellatus]PYI50673.1 hypothetical protein DLM86_28290 [Paenibacillus flagellatus]